MFRLIGTSYFIIRLLSSESSLWLFLITNTGMLLRFETQFQGHLYTFSLFFIVKLFYDDPFNLDNSHKAKLSPEFRMLRTRYSAEIGFS